MSGVMARLDTILGCRVLCGVIDCDADIASVVVVQLAPYPSPYEPRLACFAPGWQRRHDGSGSFLGTPKPISSDTDEGAHDPKRSTTLTQSHPYRGALQG